MYGGVGRGASVTSRMNEILRQSQELRERSREMMPLSATIASLAAGAGRSSPTRGNVSQTIDRQLIAGETNPDMSPLRRGITLPPPIQTDLGHSDVMAASNRAASPPRYDPAARFPSRYRTTDRMDDRAGSPVRSRQVPSPRTSPQVSPRYSPHNSPKPTRRSWNHLHQREGSSKAGAELAEVALQDMVRFHKRTIQSYEDKIVSLEAELHAARADIKDCEANHRDLLAQVKSVAQHLSHNQPQQAALLMTSGMGYDGDRDQLLEELRESLETKDRYIAGLMEELDAHKGLRPFRALEEKGGLVEGLEEVVQAQKRQIEELEHLLQQKSRPSGLAGLSPAPGGDVESYRAMLALQEREHRAQLAAATTAHMEDKLAWTRTRDQAQPAQPHSDAAKSSTPTEFPATDLATKLQYELRSAQARLYDRDVELEVHRKLHAEAVAEKDAAIKQLDATLEIQSDEIRSLRLTRDDRLTERERQLKELNGALQSRVRDQDVEISALKGEHAALAYVREENAGMHQQLIQKEAQHRRVVESLRDKEREVDHLRAERRDPAHDADAVRREKDREIDELKKHLNERISREDGFRKTIIDMEREVGRVKQDLQSAITETEAAHVEKERNVEAFRRAAAAAEQRAREADEAAARLRTELAFEKQVHLQKESEFSAERLAWQRQHGQQEQDLHQQQQLLALQQQQEQQRLQQDLAVAQQQQLAAAQQRQQEQERQLAIQHEQQVAVQQQRQLALQQQQQRQQEHEQQLAVQHQQQLAVQQQRQLEHEQQLAVQQQQSPKIRPQPPSASPQATPVHRFSAPSPPSHPASPLGGAVPSSPPASPFPASHGELVTTVTAVPTVPFHSPVRSLPYALIPDPSEGWIDAAGTESLRKTAEFLTTAQRKYKARVPVLWIGDVVHRSTPRSPKHRGRRERPLLVTDRALYILDASAPLQVPVVLRCIPLDDVATVHVGPQDLIAFQVPAQFDLLLELCGIDKSGDTKLKKIAAEIGARPPAAVRYTPVPVDDLRLDAPAGWFPDALLPIELLVKAAHWDPATNLPSASSSVSAPPPPPPWTEPVSVASSQRDPSGMRSTEGSPSVLAQSPKPREDTTAHELIDLEGLPPQHATPGAYGERGWSVPQPRITVDDPLRSDVPSSPRSGSKKEKKKKKKLPDGYVSATIALFRPNMKPVFDTIDFDCSFKPAYFAENLLNYLSSPNSLGLELGAREQYDLHLAPVGVSAAKLVRHELHEVLSARTLLQGDEKPIKQIMKEQHREIGKGAEYLVFGVVHRELLD